LFFDEERKELSRITRRYNEALDAFFEEQGKIFEVPIDILELLLITLHRMGRITKAVYVRTPQAGAEGIFA
jgi:hypothetical protein